MKRFLSLLMALLMVLSMFAVAEPGEEAAHAHELCDAAAEEATEEVSEEATGEVTEPEAAAEETAEESAEFTETVIEPMEDEEGDCPHEYRNGECMLCGAPCVHLFFDGECIFCGASEGGGGGGCEHLFF